MDLSKIKQFTSTGTRQADINWKHRHLLDAWSWSTILSYNAGVKKFLKFQTETGNQAFCLPATSRDLSEFCLWAGRTSIKGTDAITAVTLTKYLFAIQAWHNFHGFTYPIDSRAQLNLILKACAKKDAEFKLKKEKTAIHLTQLKRLVDRLNLGDESDRATADLSLIAFWGMCRMKEVTYSNARGHLNKTEAILTSDVSFQKNRTNNIAILTLRGGKTAKPGELQRIKLASQPSTLCPVMAVRRRLTDARGLDTSLFGYFSEGGRTHLTREAVMNKIRSISLEVDLSGITGHSFRVGGASLRNALGIPIRQICALGRWKSGAYKVYLKPIHRRGNTGSSGFT
ncbi:uncharacterized protein PGTG_13433 [Puccinia graminis f. sp. tritici CRL 75-36-700-3]|uniref:Tyr recombinase domain-containing protein n=1 Tax=Puccinia graminis f. sp. tritici (strain CRL 75-36-700-3 / race SCCL) TaxID=418459 RepID=E3KTT2_PUCGT|nr:uncharacterized protein PGTG_13433 [Puccinia graminis f. sp. tritici CRL 75-36-700-3]EFP87647.2 hypothetical protein PGTG_13433 [Puccinia graminis f. sp. tritici CRL 75-36-700-3]